MKTIDTINIPTYSENRSRWEVRVDLSGRRYTLGISYNTRMDAWMMTISDTSGNLLLGGIRLVPQVYFFEKYRASCPDLPPGELYLAHTSGRTDVDVTRGNLTEFALKYSVFSETA